MKSPWACWLLLLPAAACQTYDVDSAEPCRQAGFSIAARTQACTGDADLANARYERFVDQYRCLVKDARVPDFQCAVDVNAVVCTEALAFGDDLDKWLETSKSCSVVLVHADGTPVGDYAVDTPSINYQCQKAMQGIIQRIANCNGSVDTDAVTSYVDQNYRCLLENDSTQPYADDVKKCEALAVNLPCSGQVSFDSVWSSIDYCQAVMERRTP